MTGTLVHDYKNSESIPGRCTGRTWAHGEEPLSGTAVRAGERGLPGLPDAAEGSCSVETVINFYHLLWVFLLRQGHGLGLLPRV